MAAKPRSLALRGHFQTPALKARMTAGEGFQVMARAALHQALWNLEVVREAPGSEAVHQARVGLRRLRATLKTFKPVIAYDRLAAVRELLKAISSEVVPARDVDVFIAGAWRREPRARVAHDEAVELAHAAAYERARKAAADPTTRRALLDTMLWIDAGPWTLKNARHAKRRDRPLTNFAAKSLAKTHGRLIDAGAHLADLEPLARHKVRIEAKGLRYAADVFGQLFDHPKRSRRFMKALEALLGDLGDLNDIATARTLAPRFPHADEILRRENGREARLLTAAEGAFHAFEAAKPFWVT